MVEGPLNEYDLQFIALKYRRENDLYEDFKKKLTPKELKSKHRLAGIVKRLERILQSRDRSELNKDDNQEMKIFLAENPPPVATSPPRAESTQLDITTSPSMPSISVAPPVNVSVESPTLPKNAGGTQMEIREY